MKREKIVKLLQKEIETLTHNIEQDPDLDEEKRAELLASAKNLLPQDEGDDAGGLSDTMRLRSLLELFGYEGITMDDEDEDDALSALAIASEDDAEPDEKTMWEKIRSILSGGMQLKHILYSDGEDDYYTAQFGMGDEEGRQLVVRVIYTPDADCIQFRAGYPFNVDRNILPIVRSFICRRNYEMRYTRIELDSRDGEVYVCLVTRIEDPSEPPASFSRMLNLTMSVGFDEYDTLYRYSRGQFTDEERAEFLAEVEKISPLMLQ